MAAAKTGCLVRAPLSPTLAGAPPPPAQDALDATPIPHAPSLDSLPEELVLRIVDATGSACAQMRCAFALGGTCRRLRTVLVRGYLPGLTQLNQDALEALALSDPARATAALRAMLARARAVRRVALEGYPPQVFTPACFDALSRAAAQQLRVVNLAYSYLEDACVRPLLARCARLTDLSLCSCSNMNGSAFNERKRAAPIAFLDLSYMHQLSLHSIRRLADVATVRHLKLNGVSAVNRMGLVALASGTIARGIRSIDLKCCPIDDEALLMFVERCPELRKLTLAEHVDNLWDTGQYTPAMLDTITARFPYLQIVLEN